MMHTIAVDSAILLDKTNINVTMSIPGIDNIQVCRGGDGWPTPCDVGVYLDAVNRQCCIIDWPRPCLPIRFSCDYGDFLIHLEDATEDQIHAASVVAVEFFRDDFPS